jgi:hypothetical protein
VLSGWDLAEFVKFVPGTSAIRELFYVPAWCAALTLLILADQAVGQGPVTFVKQFGLRAVALGLLLAILPPYPDLFTGYRSPEFRWQFLLGSGGLLAWVASLVTAHLPASLASAGHWPRSFVLCPTTAVGVVRIGLALVGAFPALWQFVNVRGQIESVYGQRLGWGWGLGIFLVGWGLVALSGALQLTTGTPTRSRERLTR